MQAFYLDVHVYNIFKCFFWYSSVFASVSDVCFKYFQTYVQLLHLDVSKLDLVLHLFPRLSAVSPRCQAWEASTGEGSSHWCGRPLVLADRAQQSKCGRADAGRGAVAWTSGR
jgi:hypothetical protein